MPAAVAHDDVTRGSATSSARIETAWSRTTSSRGMDPQPRPSAARFTSLATSRAIEEVGPRRARPLARTIFAKDLVIRPADAPAAVRGSRSSPSCRFALGIGANAAIFSLDQRRDAAGDAGARASAASSRSRGLLNGRPRPGVVSVSFQSIPRATSRPSRAPSRSSLPPLPAAVDGNEEIGRRRPRLRLLLRAPPESTPAAGRLLEPADDVQSPDVAGSGASATGTGSDASEGVPPLIGTAAHRCATASSRSSASRLASYAGARVGSPPDLMLPLLMMLSDLERTQPGFNSLTLLARLNPAATVEQARAEAEVLYRPIAQAQADEAPGGAERVAMLRQQVVAFHAPDGFNPVRDDIKEPLLILMGAVGLILMLACVNVAGLLLERASSRQREISIRLAIGAGRGRLMRQFLTESLVLAVLGGVAGFAIAGRLGERLFAVFINGRPIDLTVAPDVRVIAFTAGVCVVACVAVGLVPAFHAFRVRVSPALKEVPAHGHGRLGKFLVVAQLAISMVLVVRATLFIGTLVNLYRVDRGFDSDGLLIAQVGSNRPYPLRAGQDDRDRSPGSLQGSAGCAVRERRTIPAGWGRSFGPKRTRQGPRL